MNERIFQVERMLRNTGEGAVSAIVFGRFSTDTKSIPRDKFQYGAQLDRLSETKGMILVKYPAGVSTTAGHLGMALKNRWYSEIGTIVDPLGDKRDGLMFACDKEEVLPALESIAGDLAGNGKVTWLEAISKLQEVDLGRSGQEKIPAR